jgi:hypothetical protein
MMVDGPHIPWLTSKPSSRQKAPDHTRKHPNSKTPPVMYTLLFILTLLIRERFPCPILLVSISILSLLRTQTYTYAENSPNLCPTISSVISTSLYTFPLCIWKTNPTKFGRIVADRACVLIGGCFSPGAIRMMGSLARH